MQKSGLIVGSLLGATVVLLAFTFIMIPPPTINPPSQIIVSNGNEPSAVGTETPLPTTRDLSLIQIFERSEEGVVQVNIQRSSGIENPVSCGNNRPNALIIPEVIVPERPNGFPIAATLIPTLRLEESPI